MACNMLSGTIRRYTTRADLKDTFKQTMTRIGSQAMILSSGIRFENPGLQLSGMTLSSVVSLSIFPKSLLLFNLHLPSHTSSSIHRHGYMAIQLLPPTSEAAKLGRIFASGIKQEHSGGLLKPSSRELNDGEIFHEMTTPFSKINENEWHYYELKDKEIKIPILNESEAVFVCEPERSLIVDNHEIWVVKVIDITFPNKTFQGKRSGGLIYFKRGFHKVGNLIEEN
ncbi:uncharacterized protein PRCAT00004985001 [Priceomyces carsonii]|uniref:uncharacterized protein n=1 Tax=Priceomyces carsonii TaxID=28549 RepID=UPI002EDAB599|nr:unnamed protein product [Priceomyces carsonii]